MTQQRLPQASRPGPESTAPAEPGSARGPIIAPLIALAGLVVVAAISLFTVNVLGVSGGTAAEPTLDPDGGLAVEGPASTSVITPPPDRKATVVGTIAFSKDGDLYTVTGTDAPKRLQGTRGRDSAPTWMPNGNRIVFIETRTKTVQAPYDGRLAKYTFYYPNVMSIDANGGDRSLIHESMFPLGGGQWHRWVLQPDVSPDGRTIALVSDGKDGYDEVLLSLMSIRGQDLRQVQAARYIEGQGHNDPEWSPDGTKIAYTYNNQSGQIGVPRIAIWDVGSDREPRQLRGRYANPSWSPDGRFLAAERTDGSGRDIVILDVQNGSEVVRLTNDGDSFSPTFSPAGDQVAYLHRDGLDVDLWIMTLDPARGYELLERKPVTEDGSLDAASPPAWFIPPDQLAAPVEAPAASTAASSAAPVESAAP
jgi:Tol biopolymer transport system component